MKYLACRITCPPGLEQPLLDTRERPVPDREAAARDRRGYPGSRGCRSRRNDSVETTRSRAAGGMALLEPPRRSAPTSRERAPRRPGRPPGGHRGVVSSFTDGGYVVGYRRASAVVASNARLCAAGPNVTEPTGTCRGLLRAVGTGRVCSAGAALVGRAQGKCQTQPARHIECKLGGAQDCALRHLHSWPQEHYQAVTHANAPMSSDVPAEWAGSGRPVGPGTRRRTDGRKAERLASSALVDRHRAQSARGIPEALHCR